VRQKADTSQLKLPHGTKEINREQKRKTKKTDMIKSGSNSPASPGSHFQRRKDKATAGRICKKRKVLSLE